MASDYYRWVRLQSEGCVSGFYYENPYWTTIMRFGIISDGTTARPPPLPPLYHLSDVPLPLITSPSAGLFLSFASMNGLEKVELSFDNKRCTGMLVHYLDGLTAVLGQWRTTSLSQYSSIYNSNWPNITHIYFKMSKFRDRQIVTDVAFSEDSTRAKSDPDCRLFAIGEVRFWAM